jgi:hypothetical protein
VEVGELRSVVPLEGGDVALWLAPTTQRGAVDASLATRSDAVAGELGFELLVDGSPDLTPPLLAAVDLDGDGVDELVMLCNSDALVLSAPDPDLHGQLVVARSQLEGGSYRWQVEAPQSTPELYFENPVFGRAGGPSPWRDVLTDYQGQVEVADLDGDGREDVLALALLPGDGAEDVPSPHLVAYLGDGHGLTTEGGGRVQLANADGLRPTCFTFLHVDADANPDLVVVTKDGAYRSEIDLGTANLRTVEKLEGVAGGLRCGSGDYTGDGVDDLAVATSSSIAVHRGVPDKQ